MKNLNTRAAVFLSIAWLLAFTGAVKAQEITVSNEIRDRIEDGVAGFQASAPFGRVELALEVLQ